MKDRPLALLAALGLACMLAAAAVALGPLEGIPHVSDEVVYTLQARLFAAGVRVGPPADNASMLAYPFWEVAPASYGVFPPGWPALLALGEGIGLGWLVNPLIAAALPALTWLLARELAPKAAPLAAGVMAASPGVWVLAASRMAHTSTLAAALAVAAVVARGRDGLWAWCGAGAAAGYLVLARPFDAAIVAGPLLLLGLARAPDLARRAPLVLLLGLAAGLLAWDNLRLTGAPLTFPVGPWFDRWVADQGLPPGCNALGFGAEHGCVATFGSLGHTPDKALRIAGEALLRLDRLLLGVPGGLLLAAGGLAVGLRERRGGAGGAGLAALALAALAPVAGYALYWSPGLAYGARFYHLAYLALPLLVALPLSRLPGRWGWVALALPLAGAPPILVDLSDRYWCVDRGLENQLTALGITGGVVFLQAGGTREAAWPALGVEEFVCDPMLEAGDGFRLLYPESTTGGLQVRHALPDPAQARAYLDALHPGAPGWLVEHDVRGDRRRISAVGADGALEVLWTQPPSGQ